MRIFSQIPILLVFLLVTPFASALEAVKVTDNVYALVGEMGQRSPTNLGNNATFGVVITDAGVVLIDSGASWKGAQQIDAAIHQLTDKPVVLVINSGGQDHRWLGNGYFKSKGARIIASTVAVDDQHKRVNEQLSELDNTVGAKGMADTQPVYADEHFLDELDLTVGNVSFILKRIGPAHTPGDIYVWLPQQQTVFAGDVVFVERMLGVLPISNSRHWLDAFQAIEALKPQFIVPGHGHPTTLDQAKHDTYDYLIMLRKQVGDLIASGGGMELSNQIDQSTYKTLKVYDEIKGRNAQQVYSEMEWE
jgi:glyoxylase-like metal-dependent hydrolase (beta-lactamase superfamily II)